MNALVDYGSRFAVIYQLLRDIKHSLKLISTDTRTGKVLEAETLINFAIHCIIDMYLRQSSEVKRYSLADNHKASDS